MGFKFDVVKHISTISESGAYSLELNEISWNDNEPKLDLRRWFTSGDGEKRPQKGITLTADECNVLKQVL